MLTHGSKQGLDPKKGEKTQSRDKVIKQIKGTGGKKDSEKKDMPDFANVKKGEQGRMGAGRFNR
jgi:hypothetical protein